jgi:hypothetical protein
LPDYEKSENPPASHPDDVLSGDWTHCTFCFYRFAKLAPGEQRDSRALPIGFGFIFVTDDLVMPFFIGELEKAQMRNPCCARTCRVWLYRFVQRFVDPLIVCVARLILLCPLYRQ